MPLAEKFHIVIPPQDIALFPGCLGLLAAGDRAAYEWLYNHYCKKVYDHAFLLTGEAALSDDVVQDVFLKIWVKREQLAGVVHFGRWLHTMTRNRIMDIWRRRTMEKEVLERVASTQEVWCTLEEEDDQVDLVRRALEGLTPRQRQVYDLIREEGLTRAQVSVQLGIAECTVKALMQKALRGVRGRLMAGLSAEAITKADG
jgi:RNA polymerase sigma factor (sigma-70 family)